MDFLSINNNYYNGLMENTAAGMTTKKLTDSVRKAENNSEDEELMKACKSFEAYMVEQVMAKMEEISHIDGVDSEKDNEYMAMFNDSFIKYKAELLTENTDLGIAKMLYESMKRNITKPETAGESSEK
ncbi:MAG: hypothetical protein ACTTKP_00465 [Catonella sp.]|uniref:hypothetical protein n=1 Tax=Catonella sp. TaxID=2382125 RepID=UPI003F9F4546